MESSYSRAERTIAALYIIWFSLNLIFFFYSAESPDSEKFWPFNTQGLSLENTYDISEFLTYTAVPLVLIIVIRLFLPAEPHTHLNSHKHTNMGFFIAFLDEKIKVEERDQKINELTGKPVDFSHLNLLLKDKKIACTKGVKTWIERVAVKDKYKEYEQDYR